MKVFAVLAIFVLTASAASFDEEVEVVGWHVPQIDGSFVWMTTSEAENILAENDKKEEILGRFWDLSPVNYYLYTQSNHYDEQQISPDNNSISNSNFDAKHPTRFIIHGWTQDYKSNMNEIIRDAWLSHGDYNIIVVDWKRARYDYLSSFAAVPGVGSKVASMIDYLVRDHGLNLDTLEVIGHSLGAHVSGYVGKNVGSGKIHAIVGLDPAMPLFSYNKPNKRLSSDDAHYVETIQTSGGKLGFLKPIGKSAFYPNGGRNQPGCGTDLTGSCSHGRSCIYYAEAVRENSFLSVRCDDYENAVKKECGVQYSGVKMGAVYNYKSASGDYYVPVHSTAPYGYRNN